MWRRECNTERVGIHHVEQERPYIRVSPFITQDSVHKHYQRANRPARAWSTHARPLSRRRQRALKPGSRVSSRGMTPSPACHSFSPGR